MANLPDTLQKNKILVNPKTPMVLDNLSILDS